MPFLTISGDTLQPKTLFPTSVGYILQSHFFAIEHAVSNTPFPTIIGLFCNRKTMFLTIIGYILQMKTLFLTIISYILQSKTLFQTIIGYILQSKTRFLIENAVSNDNWCNRKRCFFLLAIFIGKNTVSNRKCRF